MRSFQGRSLARLAATHHRCRVLPPHSIACIPFADLSTSSDTKHTPAKEVVSPLVNNLQMYFEMSKFRLSSVVVASAVAGYMGGCIEMNQVDLVAGASLTVGTFLAAMSANIFNQIIETDSDRLMARTRLRPLPSGRISKEHAMGVGVGTGVASGAILAAGANPLTAGLGVLNIGIYALPYTLSKQKTEWNTWIGAVVGAIPPLMGWVATGASLACPEAWIYGTTLFLWQFPHFFLIAWKYRRDYRMGGYQMVSVNDITDGERTANYILGYSLALSTIPLIGIPLGATALDFETVAMTSALVGGNLYAGKTFREDKKTSKGQFAWSHGSLPFILMYLLYEQWKMKRRKLRSSAEQNGEKDEVTK